jgi:hypothetical protein
MWNGHGAGALKEKSAAGSGSRNGGFFIGVARFLAFVVGATQPQGADRNLGEPAFSTTKRATGRKLRHT